MNDDSFHERVRRLLGWTIQMCAAYRQQEHDPRHRRRYEVMMATAFALGFLGLIVWHPIRFVLRFLYSKIAQSSTSNAPRRGASAPSARPRANTGVDGRRPVRVNQYGEIQGAD